MSTMLRKRRLLAAAATVLVCCLGGMQSASALEKVRLLIPVRNIDEAFSHSSSRKRKGTSLPKATTLR